MKLLSALEMIVPQANGEDKVSPVIALIGGGGKTSCLFRLGQELTDTTMLTTTTKMFFPKSRLHRGELDGYVLANEFTTFERGIEKFADRHFFVANKLSGSKVTGIPDHWIDSVMAQKLNRKLQIVVEADGAARLPAKFHKQDEPVLPSSAQLVLVVVGADALGSSLEESVHRSELAVEKFNWKPRGKHQHVNGEMLYQLLQRVVQKAQEQAPGAKPVVLINKVDSLEQNRLEEVKQLARDLLLDNVCRGVLMTSMLELEPVKDSHQ